MRRAGVLAALLLLLVSCLVHALPRTPHQLIRDGDGDNSLTNGTSGEEERVSYSGAQLWKTATDSDYKRIAISELRDATEIAIWGGNNTTLDILVRPQFRSHVAKVLKGAEIDYDVVMPDVQQAIDTENPPPSEEDEELANRKGHRMTWSAYHRLADIYSYMDYLATTYPDLCSVQKIGTSVQGRPIKVLRVGSGSPGTRNAVWVDGGIHAREWISPATVTYIISQLTENYESESEDMRDLDWYFAPVLNPDGYEYSHTTDRLWRKNRARSGQCAGTDLNRNFGHRWGGKGASRYPCSETYAGSSAFSEPETAAVERFVGGGAGARFKLYVSFHSYGQYILYPWGYDRLLTNDHQDLRSVGEKAARAMRAAGGGSYTVGPAASTLYPAAGGSDDWAKGMARIKYAYTVELRDTGRYGFILPASLIQPTAREGLAAVRVFAAAARHT